MNGHTPIASWEEYQRLVLQKLKEHDACFNKLSDEVAVLRADVKALNVRSGVWGLIGGAIPVVILILLEVLR